MPGQLVVIFNSKACNTIFALSNLTFMLDEFGLNFHKICLQDEVKLLHTDIGCRLCATSLTRNQPIGYCHLSESN